MSELLILRRSQITELVTMKDAIDCVEKAFHAQGLDQAHNVTPTFVVQGKNVSVKAGVVEPAGYAGIKCIGVVILSRVADPTTPVAIFEQAPITWLRTGAAGAVAAKHLARRDSTRIGVLGAGKQARAQVLALKEIFPLSSVTVWSPTSEKRELYAKEMSEILGIPVRAVATAEEASREKDILVTATRAREDLVKSSWISPGTHVNAMGSDLPGSQELSIELMKRGKIFADDVAQAVRIGAVNVGIREKSLSPDLLSGLGSVVAGKIPGRTDHRDVTLFDCSGIGMMDVALAAVAYERALAANFSKFSLL